MMTNRVTRIFLGLMALAFCKVGIEAMIDPQAVVRQVGISLDNPSALSSIRAVYGGMHFAFGLLCFWSLLKRPAPALWLVVIYAAGFLTGRSVSLIVDGMPNAFVTTWFGTEAFSLLASAVLLALLQPRRSVATAAA
ncbi:DUF4345 domain-containing protein [Chryseolinea sp. T2]|uniref:DUF4345 domain-containing protein n=1 Tax=Chryseolinea sp. T2 TaxID=3129255 RepID=UPI003076981F